VPNELNSQTRDGYTPLDENPNRRVKLLPAEHHRRSEEFDLRSVLEHVRKEGHLAGTITALPPFRTIQRT
jgi:hypothetical protein